MNKKYCAAAAITVLALAVSCSKPSPFRRDPLKGGPFPTLLVAQAQFERTKEGGPKPGPALLTLLRKTPSGWQSVVIEDPQSNVFHKAVLLDIEGMGQGIITIGAADAYLKFWRWADGAWNEAVIWNPSFGGTWDRLRDIEVGDVNGDGKPELVIATHDQGVVAVAERTAGAWSVKEIDRAPDVFVHEIEIGDIDGDGVREFFATPSQPNKAEGGPQPGKVVMYRWNGKEYAKTVVDNLKRTHAKEILACDLEGDGRATLFSVVEAETKKEGDSVTIVQPVRIKQYTFDGDRVAGRVIATLDDLQCRFLTVGDVDGDGRKELVASAMRTGVWMLKRDSEGNWTKQLIDGDSSGYEHTTLISDLDGDGREEIYVASDDQQELRKYTFKGGRFEKEKIGEITKERITWNITAGVI